MSVNKVDYDVLETATTTYAHQASALDDVINILVNMNGDLQANWTNMTSDAFIQRFESEHKIALQSARDAIQSISEFIASYLANRQEEDTQSASAISG